MDSEKLLIHLRAAPNGAIVEIGERPEGVSPQEWFNFLSTAAGNSYQTFSGARGVFRLTRERVEQLKAECKKSAA